MHNPVESNYLLSLSSRSLNSLQLLFKSHKLALQTIISENRAVNILIVLRHCSKDPFIKAEVILLDQIVSLTFLISGCRSKKIPHQWNKKGFSPA